MDLTKKKHYCHSLLIRNLVLIRRLTTKEQPMGTAKNEEAEDYKF